MFLDGQAVAAMDRRAVARHVAVVPQDTPADVPLTVREVVMLGRYAHWSTWDQESPEDARIVERCLERMGIADLANRPFSHLSGGERQRAVIARALAQQGSVLLMDEPNTHLDLAHQLEVYRLARALAAEGQAVLIICHDLLVSPLMVDRAVVMDRGQIVAGGQPTRCRSRPGDWQRSSTRTRPLPGKTVVALLRSLRRQTVDEASMQTCPPQRTPDQTIPGGKARGWRSRDGPGIRGNRGRL